MAKIARKNQKIFALTSGNNGQFGSAQAATKVLSSDVETLQALVAYLDGWNSATISSNKLPTLEEFQALHYISNYQLAYLFQEGVAEWNTDTNYFINSIVKKTGTYELYGSKVDDNLGNAPASGANWLFLGDLRNLFGPEVAVESGDYTILDDDNVGTLIIDDTSSDRDIDLPVLADNLNRIITVYNESTDQGKVTVTPEGGDTINGLASVDIDMKGGSITFQGTPTEWKIINTNLTSIQKQYTLSASGTNWTTGYAIGIPYRTLGGTWRLRFNIKGTISIAANNLTLTLTGVTFKAVSQQAVTTRYGAGAAGGKCQTGAGVGTFTGEYSANQTNLSYSGDVELESKPSFVE